MGEILRTTWELLDKSFKGMVVPTVIWIWRWIIIFLLWIVVLGLASLPLIVWVAWSLWGSYTSWLVRIVIVADAIVLLWIYAHFWTATVMWFSRDDDPNWADVLMAFWVVEAVIWFLCVMTS